MRLVAALIVVCACGSKTEDRTEKQPPSQGVAQLRDAMGNEDLDARLERVERAIADAKIAVENAKDAGARLNARTKLTTLIAERKMIEIQLYAVRPAPPPTPERVQELREELVSVEAKIKDTEQRLVEAKTDAERDAATQLLDALRSSKASKLRDIDRGTNAGSAAK